MCVNGAAIRKKNHATEFFKAVWLFRNLIYVGKGNESAFVGIRVRLVFALLWEVS